MEKLKPCPICGSPAEVFAYMLSFNAQGHSEEDPSLCVRCTNDCVRTKAFCNWQGEGNKSLVEATKLWNTRTK